MVAGKNDTEKRVYEALSNKNWGTSSTILNDIARDSYDFEKVTDHSTIGNTCVLVPEQNRRSPATVPFRWP